MPHAFLHITKIFQIKTLQKTNVGKNTVNLISNNFIFID